MTKVYIYTLSQHDPVLLHEQPPAQLNKNIIKSVGLYAWKMRASLEGVWYSVQNGTYAT